MCLLYIYNLKLNGVYFYTFSKYTISKVIIMINKILKYK